MEEIKNCFQKKNNIQCDLERKSVIDVITMYFEMEKNVFIISFNDILRAQFNA